MNIRWSLNGLGSAGLLALLACSSETPPENSLLSQPLEEFPESVAELGVFEAGTSWERPSARVVAYAPPYPLWSNGLRKERQLALPDGESIDSSDQEAWEFPVGSLFFKTFVEPGTDRPIETRVIRKAEEEWDFAAYLWNEQGTDAERLDITRSTPASVDIDGESVGHRVPSKAECEQCHLSSRTPVLGFSALNPPLDSEAELTSRGWLRDAVLDDPLQDTEEAASEVLAYMIGNCTACHNGWIGPSSTFDLRPEVAFDNVIEVPTDSNQTAAGIRVMPGSPEQSILFLALSGETDDPEVKSMPPIGVQLRDQQGIELFRSWIEELSE